MRLRRRLLLAVPVGMTAGAVAAAVIPTADSAPLDTPLAAPRDALTSAPSRPFDHGPRTQSSIFLRLHPGTLRTEIRRRDPAGGPDWVVRVFDADRMIPAAIRRRGSDGKVSVARCAQLGRDVHGTFGWIDGNNTFRRVTTASQEGLPAFCTSRRIGITHAPELRAAMLVDRPKTRDPQPRGSVVWGLVGGEARSAVLSVRGRAHTLTLSATDGAYLRFFGARTSTGDAAVRVQYPGGVQADAPATEDHLQDSHLPGGFAPADGDRRLPESTQVIARAADPAGGPSWGLLGVRTVRGLWCVGEFGTLIGTRVGTLDLALGTAREPLAGENPSGCGTRTQPTAEHPIQAGTASGSVYERPAADADAGALRLLPGRQFAYGRVHASVRSLTVTSPSGVKTIVPTGSARAFLLIESGEYLLGQMTFTAHLADGSTRTERL
jgi:hypothetical protein